MSFYAAVSPLMIFIRHLHFHLFKISSFEQFRILFIVDEFATNMSVHSFRCDMLPELLRNVNI